MTRSVRSALEPSDNNKIWYGYNMDILQQAACLKVCPVGVSGFACLFDCMTVGRTSDPMRPTIIAFGDNMIFLVR